jgi:hypothetical protein
MVFTLRTYISSSFSSSDIDTYPVILTNKSTDLFSHFLLYANISFSFHFLKFLIGNNSNYERYFIYSFCFYLFFIYIYIYIAFPGNFNISVLISDSVFSFEYKSDEVYWSYVSVYYGNFTIQNYLFFYFFFYLLSFTLFKYIFNYSLYTKGVLTNLTSSRAFIYMYYGNIWAVFDGANAINCTFTSIKRTASRSAIHIYSSSAKINISDSIFTNISSNYSSPSARVVYYNRFKIQIRIWCIFQ